MAGRVFVKFRWSDVTTSTRQRSLAVPIDRDEDIACQAEALWLEHRHPGQKVRLVGVGVGDLEPSHVRQLVLGI